MTKLKNNYDLNDKPDQAEQVRKKFRRKADTYI